MVEAVVVCSTSLAGYTTRISWNKQCAHNMYKHTVILLSYEMLSSPKRHTDMYMHGLQDCLLDTTCTCSHHADIFLILRSITKAAGPHNIIHIKS